MAFVRWLGPKCARMKPGANFPESVTRKMYQELKRGNPIEVPDKDAEVISQWVGMEIVGKPSTKKDKLSKKNEKNVEKELDFKTDVFDKVE
jgi:hypothetical protein